MDFLSVLCHSGVDWVEGRPLVRFARCATTSRALGSGLEGTTTVGPTSSLSLAFVGSPGDPGDWQFITTVNFSPTVTSEATSLGTVTLTEGGTIVDSGQQWNAPTNDGSLDFDEKVPGTYSVIATYIPASSLGVPGSSASATFTVPPSPPTRVTLAAAPSSGEPAGGLVAGETAIYPRAEYFYQGTWQADETAVLSVYDGKILLGTGPIVTAKLAPGTYTLTADCVDRTGYAQSSTTGITYVVPPMSTTTTTG